MTCINHLSTYILRSPLFSLESIRKLYSKEVSEEIVKQLCRNNTFSSALYLASPSLYSEMQKWLQGQLPSTRENRKMMLGIMRYYSRMCTRCTPFGLFAGVSVGSEWKNNTEISSNCQSSIYGRLDMNYLCSLSKDLSKIPVIKSTILYYSNDTLYVVGERIRYVERYNESGHIYHRISEVDNSYILRLVIERARTGVTWKELNDLLCDYSTDEIEVASFLDELIDAQVLISELEPTVVGQDAFTTLIDKLQQYNVPDICQIVQQLRSVNNGLLAMRGCKIESSDKAESGVDFVPQFENIKKLLKSFPTYFDEKYLFQVDMLSSFSQNHINKETYEDIANTINMLYEVIPSSESQNLQKFRDAFTSRYENEEIPLSVALDPELGVGYLQNTNCGITPLLDYFNISKREPHYRQFTVSPFQSFLFQKLFETLKCQSTVIELKDDELIQYKTGINCPPNTINAFVQIFQGGKYYLKAAGGACSANLISRFCHLDASIFDHTMKIIHLDESDNSRIYAEVVHLPDPRTGNILHRPALRKYEIQYLAKSCLPRGQQMDIEDLLVSVRNNKIVLRSKSKNKEIIPRLTTAHNYHRNALPVYQFLCDLQTQGQASGVSFSWGALGEMFPYLPRVIYKNAILSLQTWHFNKAEYDSIFSKKELSQQIQSFTDLCKAKSVTNEVIFEEGDNELYINLSNSVSVEICLRIVKKYCPFTLKEFVFSENDSPVKHSDNHFANEILLTFQSM